MKTNISTLKILLFLTIFLSVLPAFSQQTEKHQPSREEVLNMTYDELLNMPFEELINLAQIVGVSTDELLQMILNKDVSSASKTKEKVLQSPLSTTVISKEELEASGVTSIQEALRLVPGMIVREKTPGNYDIHIRGNDNIPPRNMYIYTEDAMSLVMIDNRPVYNYSFGGTFWETLPININDVERIEVIRGPSSALYGPNAVAGVINIITKQPDVNRLKVNGNVQLGTQNSKIANAGVTGGFGKLKFRISGNYQYMERFEDTYYVFDLNRKLTYDQMDTLHYYWSDIPPQRSTKAYDRFKEAVRNSRLATDKYGLNTFLYYDVNNQIRFNLSAGLQQSDIVSTTLGNFVAPYTGRLSNTNYFDFKAHVHGFDLQTNYMFGKQNISKGSVGYEIEPSNFNAQLEYEYKLGTLTLRPGLSYSNTVYSDDGYVDAGKHEGFLNGARKLSGLAGFVRADYKPFEALRLIAAVRADKYDIPDKTYITYQFVSTFNVNENNVLRAVYSRANRGPFIVDSHGNYNWEVVPGFYNLSWYGNKNLKLPVMDMYEVGYRTKIGQHIMIDFEAFHTRIKDYNYFIPDTMIMNADLRPMMLGQAPVYSFKGNITYYNMDLQSIQNGLTCNISVALSEKLNFRVFGTIQETRLKSFYPKTIWNNFKDLMTADQMMLMADVNKVKGGDFSPLAQPDKSYVSVNTISQSDLIDIYHKSTPTLYGGAAVDCSPLKKIQIFGSVYYFTAQSIETNKVETSDALGASDMYKVDPKLNVSLKVSYKIWKDNSIYFNSRNLFNTRSKEFAYTDEIGGLYMIGLNFNF